MPVDSNIVDAAVGSGRAFTILNRLGPGPWNSPADIAALQRAFGGPDAVSQDTALAIIAQYTAFRATGERLGNATTNRPQNPNSIPAIAGCSSAYEYQVAYQVEDQTTGRQFTYNVIVNSDRPLGRFSVLGAAAPAIDRFTEQLATVPSASGNESSYVALDAGTVVGAGRCV